MRKAGAALLAVLLLAILFLALVREPGAGDLLLAAIAAAGASAAVRPLRPAGPSPGPPGDLGGALAALPGFVAATAADVAGGVWRVTLATLGRRDARGGMVEVELPEATRRGLAVTGFVSTLSPGTVLVDADPDRGTLLFHVLGEDPDGFRARVERFYRERQRFLFP